ncbi:unnamed protein product, partial [Polarella glacialis]
MRKTWPKALAYAVVSCANMGKAGVISAGSLGDGSERCWETAFYPQAHCCDRRFAPPNSRCFAETGDFLRCCEPLFAAERRKRLGEQRRMRRSRRPLQVNSSRSLTARRQLVTGRRQLGVRRYSLRYPLPRNNGTFAPALPWNARNLSRSFEVVFVKQFNMSGSAMVRADEAAMIVSWLKVHSKSIQCSTYRQIYCTSPPRARPRVFVHVKRPCYCFEGQL